MWFLPQTVEYILLRMDEIIQGMHTNNFAGWGRIMSFWHYSSYNISGSPEWILIWKIGGNLKSQTFVLVFSWNTKGQ